ncbi:tetratricopeptide repeat protein [Rhodoferax sp.]|uniref:O-linked N-acetylglucosamine transferase, SPINDLY family protein n=1 Tax=Rhodoferax sp. TaxID=50421 RepID=UPI0019FFBE2A|nr:tetratricopeptide repeat protein [Rhodoferax sp.]MBE0475149.1 tetratricopeptide repeat protein [Rhodoferax sp.]
MTQPGGHAAVNHFEQGNTRLAQGQLDGAIASYRQALLLKRDDASAYCNLGMALNAKGQFEEAVGHLQQALRLDPASVHAHINLGNALCNLRRPDQAIAHYRQALTLRPGLAGLHHNLGKALQDQGHSDEAIGHYRQALLIEPNYGDAYLDLAKALVEQGQVDEAAAIYRKILLHLPDNAEIHSSLLFVLQSVSSCPPPALFAEHLRYADMVEIPLKPFWQPHDNRRDPERRLKVGYVSGDFHRHPVAYFLEPILTHHDKSQVELFGYSNNAYSDQHTGRIAAAMDHWLLCTGLSDEQLAARIRLDAIDILVDLSGHTALNRLPVFARKPAPVQVSYIGYPGSTGLSAIDYRISDPWQDPVGLTERYHSETLVRLAGGMAYQPDAGAPDVNALPALTSGELMLACLNNLSKVSPAVINLWARILHALPQAQLMLGNVNDSSTRERLLDLFGQAGIGPERLMLQPRVPMADYLALHHQIDLALDPFPYNGGTTTMHSLWMGVPVITLAGDHAVSRLCAAHLSRVGLDAFITHSEDEYLQCAVKFANDLPALDAVRQSLRARMNAPACQPAAITRQLEAAYRDMWRTWCNS